MRRCAFISWVMLFGAMTPGVMAIPFEGQAMISWEQMKSVETQVAGIPQNLINLYGKLELKRLTPSQAAYLIDRLRQISGGPEGFLNGTSDRELTMLIQLRDEETTKWLFSELEKGGGTSAGRILGESGVAALLPRLERFAFWPAASEPRYPLFDIMYTTVRAEGMSACLEIVSRSSDFTPKCKTWFAFLGVVPEYPEPNQRQAILRQWWDANRQRLAAGEFKHLSLPALWPGGATFSDGKSDRFERSDYLAAIHSDHGEVRFHALKRLEKDWLTDLTEDEVRAIAASMSKPYDHAREQTALLLARKGPVGLAELRKVLDHPDAEMRACAGIALLGTAAAEGALRTRYLSAILDGAGYQSKNSPYYVASSFIRDHAELKDELMPLMRPRIPDQTATEHDRLSLLGKFGDWASKEDEGILVQLLSREQPMQIRGTAYRILRYRHRNDTLPASVAELVNDPAFAPFSEGFR